MIDVLVIDDDLLDLRAAERAAKKIQLPLRMRTATDQASAIALATAEPPDVILLDVNLGPSTGEEVVIALREAGVDAAIVLLTGSADAERVAAALSAGAIKYVAKSALDPARLESTLLGAMRVTIAERRAADAQRALERRTRQLEQLVETSVAIAAESSIDAMTEAAGRGAASMCTTGASARIEMHGAISAWASNDEPAVWAFEHARGGVRVVLGFSRELLSDERLLVVELARILLGSAENVALVEEAREAARDRQDIVAIVSHDLRTPLQSLSLGIDAIRLWPGSGRSLEELGKTTDRMRRSIASMSRLLDDLLDVSRIHDHKLRVTPQRTDLDALLADVREQHQPIAAAKGLRLVVEGSKGLSVEADAARLSQALANLVSNAIRHTESGEIALCASPRAGGVRLAVRDTGSGVPREVQSKLFERLYQSDGARRGALGLGLYIVRGIAQAHGGTVGVESEPGRGALFYLDLPSRLT